MHKNKKLAEFLERNKQKIAQKMISASFDTQIKLLKLAPPEAVRKAIEDNAPKEMHEGAGKLNREGKPVTVDNLLEDYRHETEFKELAEKAGLAESWFIALTEKECEKWRVADAGKTI